jgi:hypothetical protein
MSPAVLRQFWSLVDEIRASIPLSLDDSSLEQWLLRRLRSEHLGQPSEPLDFCEAGLFSDYIHTRLPLIREFAQERQRIS